MKTEYLYQRARQFLSASKYNYDKEFYDISAIAVEEALYMALNAKLLDLGVNIPWYLDFEGLFRILSKYSTIKVNEKEMIKRLNEIRIKLGYSIPLELDKENVKQLIDFAEKIMEQIDQHNSA
ncbi:HEPN domain-containing protein [Acidianus sulfidivorans JP7]|uniref:DNA-binding protein n=1 Tax=Acidianus sulfidivorans JP7 TaxID=619593 RepID=A0A2U9IPD8_9CREN|nr:HEPN domain-containing protein [Acidianus sulfidivorans]AWR97919.1 HEPN domain-containing protein [Acidianus sulfidivorans JP7]